MSYPDFQHWLGAMAPMLAPTGVVPLSGALGPAAGLMMDPAGHAPVGAHTQGHQVFGSTSESKLHDLSHSDILLRRQSLEWDACPDCPTASSARSDQLPFLYAAMAAGAVAYPTAPLLQSNPPADLLAPSPPIKRQRVTTPQQQLAAAAAVTSRAGGLVSGRAVAPPPPVSQRKPSGTLCLQRLRVSTNARDILICGNCRQMFHCLASLLRHKTKYCKLRFTCKCGSDISAQQESGDVLLTCGSCSDHFTDALSLLHHYQLAHAVSIFHQQKDSSSSSKQPKSLPAVSDTVAEISSDNDAMQSLHSNGSG